MTVEREAPADFDPEAIALSLWNDGREEEAIAFLKGWIARERTQGGAADGESRAARALALIARGPEGSSLPVPARAGLSGGAEDARASKLIHLAPEPRVDAAIRAMPIGWRPLRLLPRSAMIAAGCLAAASALAAGVLLRPAPIDEAPIQVAQTTAAPVVEPTIRTIDFPPSPAVVETAEEEGSTPGDADETATAEAEAQIATQSDEFQPQAAGTAVGAREPASAPAESNVQVATATAGDSAGDASPPPEDAAAAPDGMSESPDAVAASGPGTADDAGAPPAEDVDPSLMLDSVPPPEDEAGATMESAALEAAPQSDAGAGQPTGIAALPAANQPNTAGEALDVASLPPEDVADLNEPEAAADAAGLDPLAVARLPRARPAPPPRAHAEARRQDRAEARRQERAEARRQERAESRRNVAAREAAPARRWERQAPPPGMRVYRRAPRVYGGPVYAMPRVYRRGVIGNRAAAEEYIARRRADGRPVILLDGGPFILREARGY